MPLTDVQRQALRALQWLYGEDRRAGRTHVMAISAIAQSMRSPHAWIPAPPPMMAPEPEPPPVSVWRRLLED